MIFEDFEEFLRYLKILLKISEVSKCFWKCMEMFEDTEDSQKPYDEFLEIL